MKKIKIEYRYWILITAILVFLTITIGGVQRTTNSGLNCADWFSCVTNWNQIISDGSQFGYIHLVLSLITGIAIVIIFSIANIQKSSMKWVKRPLNIAIFLFGLQIILKDSYTAIHFGNSLLILGLILIAAIVLFVKDFDPAQEDRLNYYSKFSKQTLVSLSLVFLILITGVGDANNTVAWVNLIHQLSVGIASIYLVWMLFSAWRTQRTQRAILTKIGRAHV